MSISTLWRLGSFILFTLGLWKLFPKFNISQRYAFIPVYRLYKLACAADAKDDGKILIALEVLTYIGSFIYSITERFSDIHVFRSFTLIVVLSAEVAVFIYSIRIYLSLIRVFHCRKRWIMLFLISRNLVILIWGFCSSFKPETSKGYQAARLSGYEAEPDDAGLTVNIEKRAVGHFYNSRLLLRDIHLSIKPGHMVMLLGGSGSGKTTFLNAVTGYEQADASILLNGHDVYKEFDKLRYDIAFVPQQDMMRGHDTVFWTISDAAAIRMPLEIPGSESSERISDVISMMGLEPVKDNLVMKQSGGQKKRISIAMEFISDPFLFILDEPDSGLDGVLACEMMASLRSISRRGKIVIVITHSPDRVSEFFDDVIILAKDADRVGRLAYYGEIDKAKEFFAAESFEGIIRKINRPEEGGDGLADAFIERFEKERENGGISL